MNAPLSRYLARFGAEPAVVASPSPLEPTVTLTLADLEARLAAARAEARTEAEILQTTDRLVRENAQAAAVAEAVAAARAEWCDGAAGEITTTLERAVATLQAEIAEAAAKALLPLLAAAARETTLAALHAAVARLVADPSHPAITVRAPADLVARLRARGVATGVALVVAGEVEASVTCGATRIETRLAAALADIAGA